MRRILLAAIVCAAGAAHAGPQAKVAEPAKHAKATASAKSHHSAAFSGHNAPRSELRTAPLDKPSGDIWIKAENLAEEAKVHIYKDDGSIDDSALAQLDDLFRCPKTGEVRAVRTELYE